MLWKWFAQANFALRSGSCAQTDKELKPRWAERHFQGRLLMLFVTAEQNDWMWFLFFLSSWLSTGRGKLMQTRRRNRRRRRKRRPLRTLRGTRRRGRRSVWEEKRAQVGDKMDHKKKIRTHPAQSSASPGCCRVEKLSRTIRNTL